jgi:hypothetical protein
MSLFGGPLQINPLPANVEHMVRSYNASKWQMEFNSAFQGLIQIRHNHHHGLVIHATNHVGYTSKIEAVITLILE